jgi:hypothetical protein
MYNSTDAPITVTCSSFIDENTITIPAFEDRTANVKGYVDSVRLYTNGKYYQNNNESVKLSSYTTIGRILTPNCSWIELVNYTSNNIPSASIDSQYFFYNENEIYTGATIASNENKYLRYKNKYGISNYEYIECYINETFYKSNRSYYMPQNGTTDTIYLYANDLKKIH